MKNNYSGYNAITKLGKLHKVTLQFPE